MNDEIKITVVPATVPTTAAAFHESATHVDALGLPVAFWWDEHEENPRAYHPTPCCGASLTYSDMAACCKKCWHEIDPAYGNVPLEPLTVLEGRAIPERPAPTVWVDVLTYRGGQYEGREHPSTVLRRADISVSSRDANYGQVPFVASGRSIIAVTDADQARAELALRDAGML